MDIKALNKQIAEEAKTLTALAADTKSKPAKLDEADAALQHAKELFGTAQGSHRAALAGYQDALSAQGEQQTERVRFRRLTMTETKSIDEGPTTAVA